MVPDDGAGGGAGEVGDGEGGAGGGGGHGGVVEVAVCLFAEGGGALGRGDPLRRGLGLGWKSRYKLRTRSDEPVSTWSDICWLLEPSPTVIVYDLVYKVKNVITTLYSMKLTCHMVHCSSHPVEAQPQQNHQGHPATPHPYALSLCPCPPEYACGVPVAVVGESGNVGEKRATNTSHQFVPAKILHQQHEAERLI